VQPFPQPVTTARDRVERLLIFGAGLLRALQLAAGLPVLIAGGLELFLSATLVGLAYLAAVSWSALLFAVAVRTNRVRLGWICADLSLSIFWLLAVPQMCLLNECTSWLGWVVPPAMGSAILAVIFAPRMLAAAGTLAIGLSYVIGIWQHLATAQQAAGSAMVNAYFIVGFAVLAGILAHLLRTSAVQVDTATMTAIEARARESAAQARFDERIRQYDVLHHTVLSTLSKIARGGLDHRREDVRALCARDADFLRDLVTGTGEESLGDFVSALAGVVRDKQALGLKVHSQFHALPVTLPVGVAPVLLGAAREALTNAAKHAGTDEAWLTAVGDGDSLRMVIVDRGTGFEPASATAGRGLMRELNHSVIEVGGRVTLTSSPGHGTMVEVQWQP
jgi:signal transduction histidine kinase